MGAFTPSNASVYSRSSPGNPHACSWHGCTGTTSSRKHCPDRVGSELKPATLRCSAAPLRSATRLHAETSLYCFGVSQDLQPSAGSYDLVLSSGFLAFAYHSGFLQAVEEAGVKVGGVMGTSSGALAGSLYCAGYSPEQVARELSRVPPIRLLRPCWRPWRGGVLSLHAVVARLRELLPPTFEELSCKLAVGVVGLDGKHRVITSGPLPEAVAASAAIPIIFAAVDIPGNEGGPFIDGGMVDRVGLSVWRNHRAALQGGREDNVPPAMVHRIARSSPFSGIDDVEGTGERRVTMVTSPRSKVNFFSLGDFSGQMDAAYQRAQPAVLQTLERERQQLKLTQ